MGRRKACHDQEMEGGESERGGNGDGGIHVEDYQIPRNCDDKFFYNGRKASVKLLIDTKTNKVLFAEGGKGFIDFLFYILSLPIGAVVRLLNKGTMAPIPAKRIFGCSRMNSLNQYHIYLTEDPQTSCPECKSRMSMKLNYVGSDVMDENLLSYDGYVKGVVTCMIMDDLVVKPMSTISSITILNQFRVKDVGSLEEKVGSP
ncbi:hypothetical protein Ancab_015030 [Ancistrocladus abbreviatus]